MDDDDAKRTALECDVIDACTDLMEYTQAEYVEFSTDNIIIVINVIGEDDVTGTDATKH